MCTPRAMSSRISATPSLPGTKYGEITRISCCAERMSVRDVVRDGLFLVGRGLARDLRRAVREHRGRRPDELECVRIELAPQPVGVLLAALRLGSARSAGTRWRLGGRLRGARRRGRRSDAIGIGVLAVPEGVERGRQLGHDGTRADHVEVDEIAVLVEREVLIADVASAGDGEAVVGDEQLVMHAMVDARNVRDRGEDAAPDGRPAAGEGIEHPHLDVRVLPEVHEVPVLARGIQIVHQHAHAHAAIRGVADVLRARSRADSS